MTSCKRGKMFVTQGIQKLILAWYLCGAEAPQVHLEDNDIRGAAFVLELSVFLKRQPCPMLDSTIYCPSIASPNSCLHGHHHNIFIRVHRQTDRQTDTYTHSKKKSAPRYPDGLHIPHTHNAHPIAYRINIGHASHYISSS